MGDALLATAPLQREDKSLIESRLRSLNFRGIETVKLFEVIFAPLAGSLPTNEQYPAPKPIFVT